MQTVHFESDIPVRYTTELTVVGAGPGGIAAAVSAARQGIRTLILDAHTMPGGMSTAARVPVFMPYSDGIRILCGGFGEEVIRRLRESSGALGFDSPDAIDAEHLKRVYEDMLTESGVHILYETRLAKVQMDGKRIDSILAAAPDGLFALKSRIFIDGTGDGTLAAWAGAPFEYGSPAGEVMPSTLCSLWAGFDWQSYQNGPLHNHGENAMLDLLEQAFDSGELSQRDFHNTGIFRVSQYTAAANISHEFNVNPASVESKTQALIAGRKRLREYERFYRRHIPGFANARIIDSGSLLGCREGRRILGDYKLTRADFDARRDFPDEIGRCNFPADIHPPRPGRAEIEAHKKQFRESSMKRGESYGIPYRILLPRGVDNLLTCGRCVSCDREVFASIRVIPGCYITGQAAGIAASLAMKTGNGDPRGIHVSALHSILRELGVYTHEENNSKEGHDKNEKHEE